jgi:23S rRNA (uridine2552-2'-O)-methyltransferase
MSRSKSSQRWLQRHVNDVYVQRSQKDGYRSRAAYKLLQLQEKDRFLRQGQVVVDLGAAPGGWLQVTAPIVGSTGVVIGLDLLPIAPLADVTLIQGDFHATTVLQQLADALAGRQADLVISDMAPNISGVSAVDQPRAIYLCELALDFCHQHLRPGGGFVTKVFQGEGFDVFMRDVRDCFVKAKTRKPAASRARSRELYLVATSYRPRGLR